MKYYNVADYNLKSKLVSQIHDELVFDCVESEVEQVKNMIHHVTFENRNGNVELDIIRNTIELANAELDVTYKYVNSANISDDEANHTLQYLRNGLQLLRKDYDYILQKNQ